MSKRCGKDFRWKVSDVGRDFFSCQKLCHFITEGVAVMFKEVIRLSSEHRFPQRGKVFQKNFFSDFSVPQINNCVWRAKKCPSRCTAGDSSTAIEEFILMDYYGGVPATENKKKVEIKEKSKYPST